MCTDNDLRADQLAVPDNRLHPTKYFIIGQVVLLADKLVSVDSVLDCLLQDSKLND